MRVAVIGAGAVGSVFGGRLALAGHDVWLVHRRSAVVRALERDGLRLSGPLGEEVVRLRATDDTRTIGPVDLVLIVTKAPDTASATDAARAVVGPETMVLTLQNGLGNLETIAAGVGAERTLMGVTYVGATLGEPGAARLTAPGRTFIGEPQAGASDRVRRLADILSGAGLPTEASEQVWDMVWGKLVINAALNATCALTRATGSTARGSPATDAWLGLVADETAAVARGLGFRLPYADAAARVRQHCVDVGPSKPSMLQDVERGRPTEIEAINGAVVRAAKEVGLAAPWNEALYWLVRGTEEVAAQSRSAANPVAVRGDGV